MLQLRGFTMLERFSVLARRILSPRMVHQARIFYLIRYYGRVLLRGGVFFLNLLILAQFLLGIALVSMFALLLLHRFGHQNLLGYCQIYWALLCITWVGNYVYYFFVFLFEA